MSSTHSDEERDRAVESSNLTRKRESNRDSGIGSMTLSEHASAEGDKDGSGSSRRGPDRGKITEDSAEKVDPVRKRLGLDDSEEDESNAIEEVIEGIDSPDELEALETLPETVDNAAVGHGDAFDLETLPSYIKKFSSSEPFKLRHSNIKCYRPLGAHKNGDVWIPMSLGPHMRSRSASYGSRPFSADVAMHSPYQRIPLSRCNSEDRQMLAAVSEMYNRSHSDPNMLETNTSDSEDRSMSVSCIPTFTELLDDPESPLGASGETSSLSSNENLLESVNNAFKKLGEKYSQLGLSSNNDHDKDESEDTTNTVSVEAASTEEKSNSQSLPLDKPETEMDVESQDKPLTKTVIKLAREFSRKAKENPLLVVSRQFSSDSCLEQVEDDKGVHDVVRSKRVTNVTSRFETFQRAMTENETWQAPPRCRVQHISDSVFHATPATATGSSSSDDDERNKPQNQDTPTSAFSRNGRNRRSVRDVVRKFEKPSPLKTESKVVTPTVMGIQERLQAIRQNAEFHKQANQQLGSSSSIKSLRERRQELDEWVSRPIPRRYLKSEGSFLELYHSDTASHCSGSEEPDGLSSYSSSVQSSTTTSPIHVARVNIHLDLKETFSNFSSNTESVEDKEPLLFRSLKERFQELEKAVSKPVPRTCANPKEEIEAGKQSTVEEKISQSQETPNLKVEEEQVEAECQSSLPTSRSSSSPVFLEATSSENLKRATSCESNYTDARSDLSAQDSSEDSFHSGYATPTES